MSNLETPENPNLPGIPRAGFFRAFADYWWGGFARISVTRYTIETEKISQGQGLRIVFLSDVHADTRFMPASRIRQAVDMANALSPDLIVLGGDYLTQNNWRMTPLPLKETVEIFSGLSAPMGVVGILGNHDWWDDPKTQDGRSATPETVDHLEAFGISVLRNEARELTTRLWLSALDSQMAFERSRGTHLGADDLDAALQEVPDDTFNILLAHEPDIFAQMPENAAVDLVISGHTHGGQIRLFGARPVVPSAYGARFAYGHHNDGRRDLIVSGGLGCSSIPVRLGVIPEIVHISIVGSG